MNKGLGIGNFPPLQNLQQLQLKFPQQLRFHQQLRFQQQLICQQQQAVVLDKNVEWKMSITKELSDRLEDGRQLKMLTVVKENAREEVSVLDGQYFPAAIEDK